MERTRALEELGWRVLRFWNHDILQQTEAVMETILVACQQGQTPLPSAGEDDSAEAERGEGLFCAGTEEQKPSPNPLP